MAAMVTKCFLTFLVAFTAITGYTQQQPMFTQYMFNGLVINPAYAGTQETFTAIAFVRHQWTGMDGAPRTQTLSAHAPVDRLRHDRRRGSPVSLGLTLFNDRIAVTDQTGLMISYAYRLHVSNSAWVSLGLQGGVNCFRVRYSELDLDDPAFATGDVTQWDPDFGAGVYFQSSKFYAGLSLPRMLRPRVKADDKKLDVAAHYFFTAGYVFDLTTEIKVKPNFLLKHTGRDINQIDLNCNVYVHETVNVGVSWRSAESVGVITRLQVNPRIGFGYAHDFGVSSELSRLSRGSHEFVLSYQVPTKKIRTINPRFF